MVTKRFLNNQVIRFRRRGHSGYPVYEIVLSLKKTRSRGFFLEKLGFFNPNFSERLFFIDVSRYAYWVSKGVSVSFNVKKLLLKFLLI